MSEQAINQYIDQLHFRTPDHLMKKLRKQFPDTDKEKLLKIINERWHDKFVKLQKIEPYYIKIFSTKPNCWFHDLITGRIIHLVTGIYSSEQIIITLLHTR